jgi:hypothetical protein
VVLHDAARRSCGRWRPAPSQRASQRPWKVSVTLPMWNPRKQAYSHRHDRQGRIQLVANRICPCDLITRCARSTGPGTDEATMACQCRPQRLPELREGAPCRPGSAAPTTPRDGIDALGRAGARRRNAGDGAQMGPSGRARRPEDGRRAAGTPVAGAPSTGSRAHVACCAPAAPSGTARRFADPGTPRTADGRSARRGGSLRRRNGRRQPIAAHLERRLRNGPLRSPRICPAVGRMVWTASVHSCVI